MARSLPIAGAARGRGAQSNRSGRYEPTQREAFDDGWTAEDQAPGSLVTVLTAAERR